jgi:hypothetical protein
MVLMFKGLELLEIWKLLQLLMLLKLLISLIKDTRVVILNVFAVVVV